MIEQYWNEMFKEFKVSERRFQFPEFSEKLISADFEKTNIVGHLGARSAMQSFKLCLFCESIYGDKGSAVVERLTKSILLNEFWKYQKDNNLENYAFMLRFLPFLVREQKEYYHFYLQDQGQIIGSLIAGNAKSSVCLFNLSISPKYQGQGHSRELVLSTQKYFGKSVFYWTKHSGFTLNASEIQDYHILR